MVGDFICPVLQQKNNHLLVYNTTFCFSILRWIVDMEGAPGTLYEGEKFQLLFKFSSRYPFDSPQVSAFFLPI